MEPPVLGLSFALYSGFEPPISKLRRLKDRLVPTMDLGQFHIHLRIPDSFALANQAYHDSKSRAGAIETGARHCRPCKDEPVQELDSSASRNISEGNSLVSSVQACSLGKFLGRTRDSSQVRKATVVVESLLGFVAVQDLLSLAVTAVAGEADDVSTPLGRLVRWLLYAASGKDQDEGPEESTQWLEKAGVEGGFAVDHSCLEGTGWTSHILRPIGGKGRPLLRSEGGSQRCVVVLQLLCHPLVTMAPDLRWCLRLIGQARATAGLINASAMLSTLGGGYFLTRQVGQAIQLARTQQQVAFQLGDSLLMGKCRVNEAYNYIWMGKYRTAKKMIAEQVGVARDGKDEELENYALIALLFLKRARAVNRRLRLNSSGKRGCRLGVRSDVGVEVRGEVVNPTVDNLHRVRALRI